MEAAVEVGVEVEAQFQKVDHRRQIVQMTTPNNNRNKIKCLHYQVILHLTRLEVGNQMAVANRHWL